MPPVWLVGAILSVAAFGLATGPASLWAHQTGWPLVDTHWLTHGNPADITLLKDVIRHWALPSFWLALGQTFGLPLAWVNKGLLLLALVLLTVWCWRRCYAYNRRTNRPALLVLALLVVSPGVCWPALALGTHSLLAVLWATVMVLAQWATYRWNQAQRLPKILLWGMVSAVIGLGWVGATATLPTTEAYPVLGLLGWTALWLTLLATEHTPNRGRSAPTGLSQLRWVVPVVGIPAVMLCVVVWLQGGVELTPFSQVLMPFLVGLMDYYQQPAVWLGALWSGLPLIVVALCLAGWGSTDLPSSQSSDVATFGLVLLLVVLGGLCLPLSPLPCVLPWCWWLTRQLPNALGPLGNEAPTPRGLSWVLDGWAILLILASVGYTAFVLQGLGAIYPGNQWLGPGNPMWDPLPTLLTLPLPVWKWWLLPYGGGLFLVGLGVFAANRHNRCWSAVGTWVMSLLLVWLVAQQWVLPSFSRHLVARPSVLAGGFNLQRDTVANLPSGLRSQVLSDGALARGVLRGRFDGHQSLPVPDRLTLVTSQDYVNFKQRQQWQVLASWQVWPLAELPPMTRWGLLPLPVWQVFDASPVTLLLTAPKPKPKQSQTDSGVYKNI